MVNHASAQAYEEGRVGAENSHFTDTHKKTMGIIRDLEWLAKVHKARMWSRT